MSFISWFSRLAIVFGLFFTAFVSYDMKLYSEYKIFFILAIIVLFLQQWVTIGRVFKWQSLKWMFYSAIIVSGLSFGLSCVNFIDYKAINNKVLSRNIYYSYSADWPIIENSDLFFQKYFKEGNIFVVNSKDTLDSEPIIIMNNLSYIDDSNENIRDFVKVDIDSVKLTLLKWKSMKKESDFTDAYMLKINCTIKMSFINRLKAQLAQAGISKVACVVTTDDTFGECYNYRPYDERLAVLMRIPPYYSSNAEMEKAFEDIQKYKNNITISHASNNCYLVNNIRYSKNELADILVKLIKQNTDYIIEYHISEDAIYQNYIDVWASIKIALEKLRLEYLRVELSADFKDSLQEYEEAVEVYPFRIIEVINDMEKSNNYIK